MQGREVLARTVGQREIAVGLRVGSKRSGERLANRPDLEKRVASNGLPSLLGDHAVVEDVVPTPRDDPHRHPRDAVLQHHWPDYFIHGALDVVAIIIDRVANIYRHAYGNEHCSKETQNSGIHAFGVSCSSTDLLTILLRLMRERLHDSMNTVGSIVISFSYRQVAESISVNSILRTVFKQPKYHKTRLKEN